MIRQVASLFNLGSRRCRKKQKDFWKSDPPGCEPLQSGVASLSKKSKKVISFKLLLSGLEPKTFALSERRDTNFAIRA